mmetsp:Transcript_33027/g.77209  ORF Transcript_33027/g.77209 Transcript_33027/m.77209 type:complete len:414 (+) Transcript_33027:117-1358(+)
MRPPCTKYYILSPGGSPPGGGSPADELEFAQVDPLAQWPHAGESGQLSTPSMRFSWPASCQDLPQHVASTREWNSSERTYSPNSLEASYAGLSKVNCSQEESFYGKTSAGRAASVMGGLLDPGFDFKSGYNSWNEMGSKSRTQSPATPRRAVGRAMKQDQWHKGTPDILESRCRLLESERDRWRSEATKLHQLLQAAEQSRDAAYAELKEASVPVPEGLDLPLRRLSRQTAVQTSPFRARPAEEFRQIPFSSPTRSYSSLSSHPPPPLPPSFVAGNVYASTPSPDARKKMSELILPADQDLTPFTRSLLQEQDIPAPPSWHSFEGSSTMSSSLFNAPCGGRPRLGNDLGFLEVRKASSDIGEATPYRASGNRASGDSRYSMMRICENLPRNLGGAAVGSGLRFSRSTSQLTSV